MAMSPNGLIEALQGLGLVDNAPELKAKVESKRRESTASLRRVGLPSGHENKFDRVSNWVSSLPVFTPLKENIAMSANRGTLRALEEALYNFTGCALITSHDRYFLDRVSTHILAFEGSSHVEWFQGNYESYEQDRKRRIGEDADTPKRIKYKPIYR